MVPLDQYKPILLMKISSSFFIIYEKTAILIIVFY